jgi:hypothetical protein
MKIVDIYNHTTDTSIQLRDKVLPFDFGLCGGAGMEVVRNSFSILVGVRYTAGLISFYRHEKAAIDIRNHTVTFTVGFSNPE